MFVKYLTVSLVVLLGVTFASFVPSNPLLNQKRNGRILEDTINASVECVREVLNDGLPEYDIPSLNPLVIDNFTLDFNKLNLSNLTGFIHVENGLVINISDFVMTKIEGSLALIPPTYTVDFALRFDQVVATGDYEMNFTLFGVNVYGNGSILSGVEDLVAAGHVKALIDFQGVHITEFDAPITTETYNFNITGLFNDPELSESLSKNISQIVPEFLNSHPEIFSEIIAPILIDIFNALVNDDAGVGIIKSITQKCILDILFPPTY